MRYPPSTPGQNLTEKFVQSNYRRLCCVCNMPAAARRRRDWTTGRDYSRYKNTVSKQVNETKATLVTSPDLSALTRVEAATFVAFICAYYRDNLFMSRAISCMLTCLSLSLQSCNFRISLPVGHCGSHVDSCGTHSIAAAVSQSQ